MIHHSCIRCRVKKIKCDGLAPCKHCQVAESACERTHRKPRTKKRDLAAAKSSISSASSSLPSITTTITASPKATAAAAAVGDLAKVSSSPPALNANLFQPPPPMSTSSPASSTTSSSFSTAASGSAAPPLRQSILQARNAVVDVAFATHLLDIVFFYRAQPVIFSCIHLPTLKLLLYKLFSDNEAESLRDEEIAVILAALSISIQFTPRNEDHSLKLDVKPRIPTDARKQQFLLHDLAISFLQRLMFSAQPSLEQVQTCILIIVYDLDPAHIKEQLQAHAVRCAEALRSNHLTVGPGSIESEMNIRAWWFLVCRDWFSAASSLTYHLHPGQFTTTLPSLRSDEELQSGNKDDGTKSPHNWIPVLWTHQLIHLAKLVRVLVDEKVAKGGKRLHLRVAEEAFYSHIENLPHPYRLDDFFSPWSNSNAERIQQSRLSIERWLLHQMIFSMFLQFYELHPGEHVSSQALALANYLVDLQSKIRAHCDIVDSMRINIRSLSKAFKLIYADLQHKSAGAGNAMVKQITLARIREAILRCQNALAAHDADPTWLLPLLKTEAGMTSGGVTSRDSDIVDATALAAAAATTAAVPQEAGLRPTKMESGIGAAAGAGNNPVDISLESSYLSAMGLGSKINPNPVLNIGAFDYRPKDIGLFAPPAGDADSLLWEELSALLGPHFD